MACENKVDYFIIDNTFDYKKVQVPCGMTNPHGERAVCHICIKDRNKMESLRQHDENVAADNAVLSSIGWGEM